MSGWDRSGTVAMALSAVRAAEETHRLVLHDRMVRLQDLMVLVAAAGVAAGGVGSLLLLTVAPGLERVVLPFAATLAVTVAGLWVADVVTERRYRRAWRTSPRLMGRLLDGMPTDPLRSLSAGELVRLLDVRAGEPGPDDLRVLADVLVGRFRRRGVSDAVLADARRLGGTFDGSAGDLLELLEVL